MFENLKRILSIPSSIEKIILFIIIISPLLAALFTYISSKYIPSFYHILPIKYYGFYLILFVFSISFLFISFLIIWFLSIRSKKKYIKDKWSFIDVLIKLAKEKGFNKKNILFLLCMLILSFYSIFSIFAYMITYDTLAEIPSFAIFLSSLMFLAVSTQGFYEIFLGFQEGKIISKLGFLFVFISFSSQYLYYLLGGIIIRLNKITLDSLLSTIGIYFIPLVGVFLTVILTVYITKKINEKKSALVKERRYENKGWNRLFFNYSELFYIIFIAGISFFIYFIFHVILLIGFIEKPVNLPFQSLLILYSLFLFMIFFILIPGLLYLTRIIVVKVFDWKEFFKIYFGKFDHQLKRINKLVKTKGKCVALSPEEYIEDPDLVQQFIMTYGKNVDEPIEVFRLKESEPLKKYKRFVREDDEIIIVGIVKRFYKKHHNKDHYNVIFAYHIESLN